MRGREVHRTGLACVALLIVVSGLGCAGLPPTRYAYTPAPLEERALTGVGNSFVAAIQGTEKSYIESMDVDGRRALGELLAFVASEKKPVTVAQLRTLLLLSAVSFTPDLAVASSHYLDATAADFYHRSEYFLDGLRSELSVPPSAPVSLQELALRNTQEETKRRAVVLFQELFLLSYSDCRLDQFRVDIKSAALKDIPFRHGERSSNYWGWITNLKSLHLFGFRCAETSGLVLMTEQTGRPRKYAFWQFLPAPKLTALEQHLANF